RSVISTYLMPALAQPSRILRYPARCEVVWWMLRTIFPGSADAGITSTRGAARGARSIVRRESMNYTISPIPRPNDDHFFAAAARLLYAASTNASDGPYRGS